MDAYRVPLDQISGPDWATKIVGTDAHYDIQATLPGGVNAQQLASMLQNLLAERFHLAVHHQTKQVTGYFLVVAKSGPKLKESPGPVAQSERGVAGPDGGYNPNNFEADGFPRLFPGKNRGATMSHGVVRMRFRDFTTEQLADELASSLAARVNDDTSLAGKYDFTFEVEPVGSGIAAARLVMGAPTDRNLMFINPPDESQSASPPVFSSALEKQLGLKLEAKKITIDLLVIDHVDKIPVEN
jgi:uncharacterized protein (TIGR03435 family)